MAQAFPALDLGALAWVAAAPLLAVLSDVTPRRGAILGFLHGIVFFSVLLYWIPGVVIRYGHLPWAVGIAVGGLLAAFLAAFHGLFGAVQAWFFGRMGSAALALAPVTWVAAAEWLRMWPAGGFPWGYLGYTQHGSAALLQLAPYGGVFGLSLLVMAVNSAICGAVAPLGREPARGGRFLSGSIAVALLAGSWAAGRAASPPPAEGTVRVAAIQGNVPQDEKWQVANRELILARHLELTEEAARAGARFILWPESSTLERIETSGRLRSHLRAIARRYDAVVVLGSVHRRPDGRYTNAAFLLTPEDGLGDRYDKMRLVPFGETVPLRSLFFFVEPLVREVGDFAPGSDPGPLGRDLRLAGRLAPPTPFGVAICYEVIYPQLVAAQVRAGASFLTTITNDAWFGRTAAPAQHFAMAAFRAVESRRWLLRAANTGISGLVTPRGEVIQATPLFVATVVEGSLRPRSDLTWAVRHPQAVPLACVMITLLAAAAAGALERVLPWKSSSAPATTT
jgi:apolipoprotein N-acyltransferase